MSQDLQLCTEINVGGQELSNRVVMASMTRARCTPSQKDPFDPKSRIANDRMQQYYEQRAGAGLIISEATCVSEEGYGWRNTPEIRTQEQVEAWKKITDGVHAKNGTIYIQLWHMGRRAHSSFHPTTERIVGPSDIPLQGTVKTLDGKTVEAETPVAMSVEDIRTTIDDFVQAAKRSQEAGFDGIELNAANGYLIDQFLQSCTNQRQDDYGGSLENRFRFL